MRPKPNNVYYCHNPKGIRLLTRLRLALATFANTSLSIVFKTALILFASAVMRLKHLSTHYLLHCPTYTNERMTFLNKNKSINCSILEFIDDVVTKILLFGDNTLSNSCNTLALNSTIDYIISTKRFDDSILTPG